LLIDLEHIRLNVVDEGDGRALLLLHGMGANHRIWTYQLDAFHGELRCVAPDLRGAGQSEQPPGPYCIEGLADDVAALCERIGVDRAVAPALVACW
jgi:3-oxoadipate enol-lactonase